MAILRRDQDMVTQVLAMAVIRGMDTQEILEGDHLMDMDHIDHNRDKKQRASASFAFYFVILKGFPC
jgi:hypothetical protein